jgi:ATP-dependent DNA helicase RecG
MESQIIEYKSIKKILSGDFKDLAKTCVCLANAQGGTLIIGFEDKTLLPPENQKVEQKQINDTLERLRGLTFSVGLVPSNILIHENGGEYFEIQVLPSQKIVATTSDGKIYIRIADKCEPVGGTDLQRIVAEKDSYQWELVAKNYTIEQVNQNEIKEFVTDIRNSIRVKFSVKQKSNIEILEHYNFVNSGKLTNLGILWLGNPQQRASLSYPITVQYIVYNDLEQKSRKILWDDYALNPKQLLLSIEKEATELNYFYEFPDGLFRKQIRHYPQEVIRELIINAFAHKSYLISADIMIGVYPNKFQISSPGSLPLGITKDNILHQQHRRNPHLIKVFHDLNLMEAEGSGYDLIYEKLCSDAKSFPYIESDFSKVMIELIPNIIDIEALKLIDYISQNFNLSQREKIVIGIVAQQQKILSTKLSKLLQLTDEDRLRSWIGQLTENKILIKRGQKKANEFLINPNLLQSAKLNIKPSLKTIEPHVLEELIKKDLEFYPKSTISQMHERMKDVLKADIQKIVYKLAEEGFLDKEGSRTDRSYSLAKKKRNEKE